MEFFNYQVLKTLHIISFVSWFAALFYFPRLLICFVEAESHSDSDRVVLQKQFLVMMRRLWFGIAVPSMIATLIFGFSLFIKLTLFKSGWMHTKFLFVFLLVGYHHYLGSLWKKAKKGLLLPSSKSLRIINEFATLFLIIIVALAVFKAYFSWVVFLPIILFFSLIVFFVIHRK